MNSAAFDEPRHAVRPVIGICARTAPVTLQGSDLMVSLALQAHVTYVAEAGCTPLLLPLLAGVEESADRLDGLLVPGGPDVDPQLYGQPPHPATRSMTPDADRVELALMQGCWMRRSPYWRSAAACNCSTCCTEARSTRTWRG